MPLPRVVARLNRRYTNRFIEPIVRRFPGFMKVHHIGRRTGRHYTTPVYGFHADAGILVALTYGPRADWVLNVQSAPGAIAHEKSEMPILGTRLVGRSVAWPHVPRKVRLWLRVLAVHDFLELRVEGSRV